MATSQARKVGKRGAVIRPAVFVGVEMYTPTAQGRVLLSNATGKSAFRAAREAVKALGLDPDKILIKDPPKGRAPAFSASPTLTKLC